MPKGLIPLMLSSPSATNFGSRSSVLFNPDCSSNKLGVSNRRSSISPPVSPAHKRNHSDVTPMIKLSRPPVRTANMRRQSQQLPVSLPDIPFSSAEWKKAITEIKQYHVARRFRACSARCNEILTNVKDIFSVEPAYLIYLNFYAATSLEMCAKPLAQASAYRISLLQQARTHYERAAALIQTAEENAWTRSRSSSAASSLPSLHSPSGSVSSRAWTPDCGISTPTSAISRKSSLAKDPLRGEARGRATKKKVSFELPKDKSRWSFTLSEPVIRPDSPTLGLGFDDEYFAAGALRQELPEIPAKRCSKQDFELPTPSPPSMPSISEGEELCPTDSPSTDAGGDEYPFFRYDLSDPASVRSLARYCETLGSLKMQVASHTAALDRQIERDAVQQHQQPQLDQPDSPILHDPTTLAAASFKRMSLNGRSRNASLVSGSLSRRSSSMSFAGSEAGDLDSDEARNLDRQARIDKLRMNGWKRKRFNVSRYEELRATVMEELNACDA